MAASTSAAARFASVTSATAVLMLPALWNCFPLLEYDTGGYLARWFEGYLVPSRSTTYGLFLTAGWPLDFWPIVILQAAAAVWIVGLVLRLYRFNSYPAGLVAIVVALALTTSLPWLASELLTDIFAGLAVLALDGLVRRGDRIAAAERVALVAYSSLSRYRRIARPMPSLLALAVLALAISLVAPERVPRRGVARAATALLLVPPCRRHQLCRRGSPRLDARRLWPDLRAHAGGRHRHPLSQRSLSRSAAEALAVSQRIAAQRRHFLWNDGVFDKLGRFAGLDDEMRRIVLGSLRDYPMMQIKAALIDTARQLGDVATGYGILTTIWHTTASSSAIRRRRFRRCVRRASSTARSALPSSTDQCACRLGRDGAASNLGALWITQRRVRRSRRSRYDLDPRAARQCRVLRRDFAFSGPLRLSPGVDSRLHRGARGRRAISLARQRTVRLSRESASTV